MKRRVLRRVSVVHRHGDRVPAHLGTLDPSERRAWESLLPEAGTTAAEALADRFPIVSRAGDPKNKHLEGRLTLRGAKQCENLGRYLRQRYGACSLHVRSSNYLRTQQSAQFLLSGLRSRLFCTDIHVPPTSECVIDAFSRYESIHKLAAQLSESEAFVTMKSKRIWTEFAKNWKPCPS